MLACCLRYDLLYLKDDIICRIENGSTLIDDVHELVPILACCCVSVVFGVCD